jgi:hypothetical protein
MTDPNDRVERALEVLVYAPLGFGLWLRDLAPSLLRTVVARGRAEVDRRQEQAQQRITTARSMGQVALAFGVPELRKRASAHLERAEEQVQSVQDQADRLAAQLTGTRRNGDAPTATRSTARTPAPARRASAPATTSAPATATAKPGTAKPAKDTGPAAAVAAAHLPIPGYDALSASQVVERLTGLGVDDLAAVRTYEGEHRNRRTILGKIDQLTSK